MSCADKALTGIAEFVPRRRVLLHALALVGATIGLAACKHLPVDAPVGNRDRESNDDRDGGGGGGDDGGGGGDY